MKTPQIPAMPGMTPLGLKAKSMRNLYHNREALTEKLLEGCVNHLPTDQKTVAERKWQAMLVSKSNRHNCK